MSPTISERLGDSPMVLALESSRHFPSAVAFGNGRNCGRHTACACYFGSKSSDIGRQPSESAAGCNSGPKSRQYLCRRRQPLVSQPHQTKA